MARGTIIRRRTKTKGIVYEIKYRTADEAQVKQAVGPSRQEAQRALNEALAAVQRGEPLDQHGDLRRGRRSLAGGQAPPDRGRNLPRLRDPHPQATEAGLRRAEAPPDHPGEGRGLPGRTGPHTKLSRKTLNDSLIPLRQILGAAVREGVLARNPAKNDDRDHPLELPYERPTMHT